MRPAAGDSALRAATRAIQGSSSAGDKIVIEELPNIAAAIDAGVLIDAVYLRDGDTMPAPLAAITTHLPVLDIPKPALHELFRQTRAPRMFAVAAVPPATRPKDLAARPGDLLVLDGVAGPGNIGSVIRLADAFEAAGVVLLDVAHRDIYHRGTIRAATGSLFRVPVVAMTQPDLVAFCTRNCRPIAATSAHRGDDVRCVAAAREQLAIVFGGETRGVRPSLTSAATRTLHVPMPGPVESLNISSAAAIVLFQRYAAAG